MKKWLTIITAAGLLLYPFATFAADYASQPPQAQQAPPVAQPLVREGDFALKLAATLDLGAPTDEAIAEDMLAKAGVAPLNGWISDYPVTPQVLGQLEDSIAKAGGEHKLPMTAEEAKRGLNYLVQQMSLASPAGAGNTSNGPPSLPAEASNPTVINNYYVDEGPPVITYYPPPYDYVYLYDWVPYPVFWFGFWFPGFYICHDFTTTVIVSRPFFDHDRTIVSRTAVVSNHVIDPVTRTSFRVDPVGRSGGRTIRPATVLQAPSGRTFTTLGEMRNVVRVSGLNAVKPGPSSITGTRAAGGFRTPESRKNAETIYSRSAAIKGYGRRPEPGSYRGDDRRMPVPAGTYRAAPPATERSNGTIRRYEGQNTAPGRTYREYHYAPGGGAERRSVAPGRYRDGSMLRGAPESLQRGFSSAWQGNGSSRGRTYVRPSWRRSTWQ